MLQFKVALPPTLPSRQPVLRGSCPWDAGPLGHVLPARPVSSLVGEQVPWPLRIVEILSAVIRGRFLRAGSRAPMKATSFLAFIQLNAPGSLVPGSGGQAACHCLRNAVCHLLLALYPHQQQFPASSWPVIVS